MDNEILDTLIVEFRKNFQALYAEGIRAYRAYNLRKCAAEYREFANNSGRSICRAFFNKTNGVYCGNWGLEAKAFVDAARNLGIMQA